MNHTMDAMGEFSIVFFLPGGFGFRRFASLSQDIFGLLGSGHTYTLESWVEGMPWKKMMRCGEKRYFFPIIGVIFSNLTGLISVRKNNSSVTKKSKHGVHSDSSLAVFLYVSLFKSSLGIVFLAPFVYGGNHKIIRFSKVNNTSKNNIWFWPHCLWDFLFA